MQQPSSYAGQSYAQPVPVILDPANQAYAEGWGNYPSQLIGKLLMSLFLLSFFVVGSVIVWQALQSWFTANELQQSGVRVEARVVSPHFSTDNKGFKHYSLLCTFTAAVTEAPGKPGTYQKEASVTQSTYDSHPAGSTITIRYLPADPNVSDVANQPDSTGQNPILLVLAALLYGSGIGLSWFFVRRWRLEGRLKRQGQLLSGYLLSTRIVKAWGANGRTSLRIEYRFATPQGNSVQDKQSFIYNPAYHDPLNLQLNQPLVVAYADDKHYQVL